MKPPDLHGSFNVLPKEAFQSAGRMGYQEKPVFYGKSKYTAPPKHAVALQMANASATPVKKSQCERSQIICLAALRCSVQNFARLHASDK
ncbi:hypothetical protein TNIN_368451 [Trichonephila inaurata madagascariensis]|uniref:Uncharacterized protein n=1 Tax=Trichonephila inaurata madagascariensis TaxID=2747483 RepID=A0A8X7CI97_9ARAC|nr:hypothetical protein TNIN_368451 [Trichonephila inaurata madagascariensis]